MKLAITLGDPSGVGPEILLRTCQSQTLDKQLLVYGDYSILQRASEILNINVPLHCINDPTEALQDGINIVDLKLLQSTDLKPGIIDKASGAAARAYVVRASKDALAGKHDGIVTLPMNKESTQLSDPKFCGHTELIADTCNIDSYTMMLATPQIAVTHVSTHVSLSEAIQRVKKERVLEVIQLTHQALTPFIEKPRIAIAGLNPHAGEHGLFGNQEQLEILPAIESAQALGIDASGPHPADTVFHLAINHNRYDAIVVMYHDQGHVPMKLIAFEEGVNVTIGLPIMRCSVDHGTAFDIAYQGKASTRNFEVAYAYAQKLCGTNTTRH